MKTRSSSFSTLLSCVRREPDAETQSAPVGVACTRSSRANRRHALWAGLVASALTALAIVVAFTPAAHAQAPATNDGWVVLPIAEYRALREAAFPTEREPEPPPVDATLTQIDYDLKVEGDVASGEARLTIDVIKNGWVSVAIPPGLMVREARLDGQRVSLATETRPGAPPGNYLLLSRPGRAILTLSIAAPVTTAAGTELLRLPVSASAVSRAVVVLPRLGVDVRLTGGMLLERTESAGASRWVAHGRSNDSITFAWKKKIDDQRASQPLRLRGALTQLVGLGEDTTQLSAEVFIEVLQGVAKEARVQLPVRFTVNQVTGAMVADWEAKAGELVVSFLEPVQQTARFLIAGEVPLPREGQMQVPLLRLGSAERETGGLAVEVLGAGEIRDRRAQGLDEAEAADLGQLVSSRQSPSLIAFRLRPAEGRSDRSLSINVARYTPQAVLTANVEEARYNLLITEQGKMLVQARLAVRNNQRSFLKLSLPATGTLWSASVAGRPVRPGRSPDGALLLPLEKTRTGEEAPAFLVEIAYLDRVPTWTDKGRARLSLMAVDMPVSRSGVLIHHSPMFRLTPVAGSFRGASYQAPMTVALSTAQEVLETAPAVVLADKQQAADGTPDLVARAQRSGRAGAPVRNLPIRVAFPHFGPSIYVVSELTSEGQTPTIETDYQRERRRGEQ